MNLPYTTPSGCTHHWHYHWNDEGAYVNGVPSYPVSTYMAGDCDTQKVQAILAILSSTDVATTLLAGHSTQQNWQVLDAFQRLTYYTPRYWAPMVAATVRAVADSIGLEGQSISYDDLYCHSCSAYVNKHIEPAHWQGLCGSCQHHSDECECCDTCHESECVCCQICGEGPSWQCDCCSYCEQPSSYCECRLCRSCGYKEQDCGCYSGSHSYFGETNKAPWLNREDLAEPMTLPRISDCENHEIDPVRAAADFYLLDAVKSLIRTSEVHFANEDMAGRFAAERAGAIKADSMLSALVTSAERSYRNLVDYLAPNFLAYALPAVGGELRYHRAVGKAIKATSREQAWDKFVGLVEKKGAETLFEADALFLEFGGGAYGGKKWGDAAKVVGKYLSGSMPAWLFVDRVFTLEHNGGCFLNKVNWSKRNGLHWGLSKMSYVLNAHAGKNYDGQQDKPTDWRLLCDVASPGVAGLFMMAERHLARLARRYGGVLAPVGRSHIRRDLDPYSYR